MNLDLGKLIKKDAAKKREKKKSKEEQLTVRDYIGMLGENPQLAQNAHARGLEVVCGAHSELVEDVSEEDQWIPGADKRYPFFTEELYGLDWTIARIVEYLEAGKNRASTGKQVLLLVGPPGTGKSTIVRRFMEGFEQYNLRPVYKIKGCPKFEEPLHVVPRYAREEVQKELGVNIEGDLCFACRDMLKREYTDADGTIRWWDIPIDSLSFSVQGVRGLSSFEPSDEKSADMTALSGRENIAVTSQHGFQHPKAYEISGTIPKGERGVVEGRELTSSDTEILRVFFSVAEERQLEIPGSSFPHLSVDTIVIGHTNITPFKKFASNKEYEGLHNRFYVVKVPRPVRVKDELALYRKLIERESDFVRLKKCHIAPGSLEIAALFAVMTRLIESQKGASLLTKAKVYNGDKMLTELEDADTRPKDVNELLEEGKENPDLALQEGMGGVSSRDVLAALNTEIVRQTSRKKCLTPLMVIEALRKTFKDGHRMGYTPEQVEHFVMLLSAEEEDSVMTEYKDYIVTNVSKAFLDAYDDLARELFDRYVHQVRRYRDTTRKFMKESKAFGEKDLVTGKEKEPDKKLMRSVEKHIGDGLGESEAEVFRGEMLEYQNLSYDSYPPLARAIEKKLLEESKDMLSAVLATDKPLDTEERRRASDLFRAMQKKYGYCEVCAKETVDRTREILGE